MPGRSAGSAAKPPRTATANATFGRPRWETSHTVSPLASFEDWTAGARSGCSAAKGGRSLGRGTSFCAAVTEARERKRAKTFRLFIVPLLVAFLRLFQRVLEPE